MFVPCVAKFYTVPSGYTVGIQIMFKWCINKLKNELKFGLVDDFGTKILAYIISLTGIIINVQ